MNECPFYYYDSGYSCAAKRKSTGRGDIDSDLVHRYCWSYSYEECPIFKKDKDGSGGCFLTSACVEARGLPDDCEELTVLRRFRDGWLREQTCGACEIEEYYRVAPGIVAASEAEPNAKELWEQLYRELITPCVGWIQGGEMEKAHALYRATTMRLKENYLG